MTALTRFLRFVLAACSGWLVFFSYEPHGHWFSAIVGISVFYLALMPWQRWPGTDRPSAAFGGLLGFTQAAFCYLYLLPWIGEFVGAMPYVALSIFLALYGIAIGVFGVIVARWRFGFLAFALIYLAVEFCRSSFPFGGFSWVRLAWGQINGPLAALAPWGGPALISIAVALAGAGLTVAILQRGAQRWAGLVAAVLPLGLGTVAQIGVNSPTSTVGEATVAAVQGNVPRMGLDFNAQRRAVLANHVNETLALRDDLRAQNMDVDAVFWPENSSDVNPFTDSEARALIDVAVRGIDAPLLVGTLTRDDVGSRNTMVVFDPKDGPGEYHHKRFLQPFGEYMPMRDFFRRFSDMVDLAGNFKPGYGNGVVHLGNIAVGVATCYEVAEDEAYRMAIRNGAQLLSTPTNNATFGFTGMTYQQLAMSRMRALETDRAVVVVATSGVSAIVHPDGSVSQQTEIFTADHLVEKLPLRDSVTPAVRFGKILEWLLVAAGIMLMAVAGVSARTRAHGYAAPRNK